MRRASGSGPARRSWTLDPHDLVLKAGTWYLVARSEATIRMSPAGRLRGRVLLDAPVAAAIETNSSGPDTDGWTTAVVPTESVDHAYGESLKFGANVEVLEPQELRSRFEGNTRALTTLYGA